MVCGDFYVSFVSLFIYYISNSCQRNGNVHRSTPAEAVNVDNIDVPDFYLVFSGSSNKHGFYGVNMKIYLSAVDPETQRLLADSCISVRQREQFKTNRIL